jgi:D-beta-D-heptose 7-phosphate kinase/D-beta-D-heptose 1-phosphate adenosyltransferase
MSAQGPSPEVKLEGWIAPGELERVAAEWHRAGRRVVFTNGCFDLLHPGHLALLEDAAGRGDVLLVAINDDASVERLKGTGRPIYPAAERAELLLALRWVDAVTMFSEDTPLETIQKVKPDVLVKGSEYGEGEIVGEPFVLGYGGEVRRFPMKPGYATSRVIRRIAEREEDDPGHP